jgi:hypothetical protein
MPTAIRFPNVVVTRDVLANSPAHLAMSKVTTLMWAEGVPEAQMEEYCAAIAGLEGAALVETTSRWVRVS